MTDGNGMAPDPVPVLSGHLVLYADHMAFRPDGGDDDSVIHRPLVPIAYQMLVELLGTAGGGVAASIMGGQMPLFNRAARRAAKSAGLELPSGI